jgi:hypothetical protein
VFNFLGGPKVGVIVAEKSWWACGPTLHWKFFYILGLGYCFNQVG